jgi:hypothetical protein
MCKKKLKNTMQSLGNLLVHIQEKRGERKKYMYAHCKGLQESTRGNFCHKTNAKLKVIVKLIWCKLSTFVPKTRH